jgi:hypothetical protein
MQSYAKKPCCTMSRCKNPECRATHAAYERHRTRMIAYGRWQPFVDAEPVRAHVRRLMADGLSRRRIAELADVTETTVIRLLYGQADRPPSRKIRTENARALLTVESGREILGPTALIDGTGTRRRLQALVAQGWSRSRLAEQLGNNYQVVGRYMVRDRVTASTARAVRGLYDRLWDAPPPERNHWEVAAAVAARRKAERNGWAKPMAWDDETIDDPDAEPRQGSEWDGIDPVAVERAIAGESVPLSPAEIDEVIRIGNAKGMSALQIAAAAGCSARAVQRRRATTCSKT